MYGEREAGLRDRRGDREKETRQRERGREIMKM